MIDWRKPSAPSRAILRRPPPIATRNSRSASSEALTDAPTPAEMTLAEIPEPPGRVRISTAASAGVSRRTSARSVTRRARPASKEPGYDERGPRRPKHDPDPSPDVGVTGDLEEPRSSFPDWDSRCECPHYIRCEREAHGSGWIDGWRDPDGDAGLGRLVTRHGGNATKQDEAKLGRPRARFPLMAESRARRARPPSRRAGNQRLLDDREVERRSWSRRRNRTRSPPGGAPTVDVGEESRGICEECTQSLEVQNAADVCRGVRRGVGGDASSFDDS